MEKPSTARVALKWGLISAVISIVYSVVMIAIGKYQDPSMNTINSVFAVVVTVGILVATLREYRTLNGGYMSFGQGLGVGTLASGVAGVAAGLFNLIYMQFIDPTVSEQMLDRARDEWERNGLSDSQIEQIEPMTAMMMKPGMIFVLTVFISLLFGLILSLVIAAILRREKQVFE